MRLTAPNSQGNRGPVAESSGLVAVGADDEERVHIVDGEVMRRGV
jgi:hypothetical protein